MSEARPEAPMAGVAMTAIGVAVIRVRESDRPDRLYNDPLARDFVAAARRGFAATEDGAQRWTQLEALADTFFEGRTVTVRLIDDQVTEAVAQGCRQVVVLGAGLDTRAFRLGLPADIRFFEIDLPELFAFKEPVLAGAVPTCDRRVVAADLRGDWAAALRTNGFQPDVPTHWVDEGVLGYLSRAHALRLAETLTELSAPASRFDVLRFAVDENPAQYSELRRLVRAGHEGEDRLAGLGPDAEKWLADRGWHTTFRSWAELVAPLDRPVDNPGVGLIIAVRA
ncbi:SAM-dependent methyltransferase [Nocardia suismassiliense]|uniref:SAM-dependent methyltransferase n=1 Tax=Nocardia suismassiliense TaxID=2077092 RepID=UPI001F223273|nr:SAM-dependent methyltransferase [Nocardia suismassiliense]